MSPSSTATSSFGIVALGLRGDAWLAYRKEMRGSTGLILFLINAVWSLHPVMSKWALEVFSPVQVGGLRYTGAGLSFVLVLALSARARAAVRVSLPRSRSEWLLYAVVGLAPFCFSPLLQLRGLTQTHAVDNALIVSLEPLFTVALAWFFFRRPSDPTARTPIGVWATAFTGLFLLTGLPAIQGELAWERVWGNCLLILSLLGEASYSVAGRALLDRGKTAIGVFGVGILIGVLGLLAFAGGTGAWSLAPQRGEAWGRAVFALFWLGPLGTALCYLLWVRCLERATMAQAALSLFFQPLLGTLGGVVLLEERLSAIQWCGALLLGVAVFRGQGLDLRILNQRDPARSRDDL